TVDHRDHGLVHLLEGFGDAVHALPQAVLAVHRRGRAAVAHAAHVAARAERAAGAGDDDHVDLVVGLGVGQRLGPRLDHVAGERVELVRPVERYGGDFVLHVI